jgi:hypothetical protein
VFLDFVFCAALLRSVYVPFVCQEFMFSLYADWLRTVMSQTRCMKHELWSVCAVFGRYWLTGPSLHLFSFSTKLNN